MPAGTAPQPAGANQGYTVHVQCDYRRSYLGRPSLDDRIPVGPGEMLPPYLPVWVEQADDRARKGLGVLGYGPGSVDTGIRRELPALLVAVIKPFFAFTIRTPAQVARQLADLLATEALEQKAFGALRALPAL